MEYAEALERLYDLKRYAYEPGIERTEAVLDSLDRPHETYPVVQIAGTNGKGSTAAMATAILEAAGHRVGLYTSPHLSDVRERVRVDGRSMPKAALVRFVDAVAADLDAAAAAGRAPTFFEVVTAMALWYFAEADVDVAIVEAGIGGRHDATSVVDPRVTAVTTVDLEHTEVLGDTVEAIADDKLAIAGGGVPLVTGTTGRAREVVRERRPDATVVGAGSAADVRVAYGGLTDDLEAVVELTGSDWSATTRTPLLGAAQAVNAGMAAAIAREGWAVDEADIATGVRGVDWPGRTELFGRAPRIMLDGAHNPPAATHLAGVIDELPHDRLHLVVGAMADKDLAAIAEALPTPATLTTCRPETQRAASPRVLEAVFEAAGAPEVHRRRGVESAMFSARDRADPGDLVVVTGSLFTVGEARRPLVREVVPRRLPTLGAARAELDGAHVTDLGVRHMRAKAVHRSLRLRVTPRQAQYLKEELLSLGGECATSSATGDGTPIDVVTMATLAQYRRLVGKLQDQAYGLPQLAEQLRRTLGIRHAPPADDWPWTAAPVLMGIVNVTPDSFHDGGAYAEADDAVAKARRLAEAGAAIVDVGGESTRPGGDPVPADLERERVVPVVEALADEDVLVSIDTRKADVAAAALDAGADLVNDVSGLDDPAMAPLVADRGVPVVVMHSRSTPVDPSTRVEYDDVVLEVREALGGMVRTLERFGVDRSDVIVDPGIGFGKSPAESFALLDRLEALRGLDCAVMVGHSHKSLFAHVGYEHGERLLPTVAGTALAVERGADIVRVHDVAENRAALETARQVLPVR
ncbi:MAG: dihydropteroate synthase [Halobacteriales archaeon]